MKTKLVKFEAPKESTIYNPPLKMVNEETKKEYHLLAYVANCEFPFVCKENAFRKGESFQIEVPEEPQRMTNFQLLQFLNRGGWIMKNIFGGVGASPVVEVDKLNNISDKLVKVSRIEEIEWIEPTTDLLEA